MQICPPDGATCISSIFDHQMASLALVTNMSTRWHHKTLPEAQRTQNIDSITWVNLSTIIVWNWFQWNFLQIWPPDGATCNGCQFCHWWTTCTLIPIWPPDGANCISCKFAHQMALLSLVPYLTTRWHHLHWLQTWPPDVTTCIGSKFYHHQILPIALGQKFSITNDSVFWNDARKSIDNHS